MGAVANRLRGRRQGAARLARGLFTLFLLALLFYLVGFVRFIQELEEAPPAALTPADGIVVLTGTPERLPEAVSLLKDGKGKRLLVSGVNPDVTREELRTALKVEENLFACCIDLDWRAADTIGNAAETAAWARKHQMRRLIVVTSAYHLPRALKELEATLPGTELAGYPVFRDQVHIGEWWAYPGTARLLAAEYTKYLVTLARTRLGRTA
ncbi:YdcF family protein [Tepidicaulis sp. LMO-SS28]|uniref:YdcF family protein n=1 Tax=Tepidicaulis sp. LMO-SS28 TaxID=3447455 RepID=UPI003EDF43E6